MYISDRYEKNTNRRKMKGLVTMKKTGKSRLTYAVLTCCMIAVSVGAWGAANGTRSKVTPKSTEPEQSVFNIPSEDVEVDVPLTDVPDTREYETEMTETTVTDESDNTPYTGNFALPTASQFITKDYSGGAMVYSNTMQDWRIHNGIDFGESRGQPVMAIHDGVVTNVKTDALWGTSVTIDHGNGIVARYCGLSPANVPEEGCHVEKYAVIGTIDTIPIESKDGPHLHFEITVDGKTADPLKVINKK